MSKSVTPEQLQRELGETVTLPIVALLGGLFVKPKMFASLKAFSSAGFKTIEHAPQKIMSGSHKSAPGYLFKKYNDDKPAKKQLVNYMRRIEGARRLRAFIAEKRFQGVVAPQKWLYELPPDFQARYLVVAERLELVSDDSTKRRYGDIGKTQMQELATILFYFRGLNSTASNLPFTEDGKIAFIDTERWHHDKDYLHKVEDRLSSSRRSLAMDVYEELHRAHQRPFRSQFK